MLTYCYDLIPDDNATLLIQFPDIPEAAAVAECESDAPGQAADGLEAALQMYIDARRPLPVAAYISSHAVRIKTLIAAKLLLSDQMVRLGVKKAVLARMLGVHPPQIDRLLDLGHSSKIEAVEAAFEVLNRQIDIAVNPGSQVHTGHVGGFLTSPSD